MNESARTRILDELPDDARVLDVGGWAVPFPRADWVLDLGSYETRGEWGYDGDREDERFAADTWIVRDICDREPWPFAEGFFDFAICSHTLEDVRDPVFVCSELQRVARAGYIEVPSRLEEQTFGIQGEWVGWGHHHWLIDVDDDAKTIDFVFKHHVLHRPDGEHVPAALHAALPPERKIQQLWWEDGFGARERIIDSAEALHAYLREAITPQSLARDGMVRRRRFRRSS